MIPVAYRLARLPGRSAGPEHSRGVVWNGMRRLLVNLRALAALAALLVYASPSFASIAFDAHSAGTAGAGNTISWTHTVGATANRVLFVSIYTEGSSAGATCTYNSVSMTLLTSEADGAGATETTAFILAGPATGANTVSCGVTNSGGIIYGQANSYFGVNQSTPNRTAVAANDGGSGSSSTSVAVSNAQSGDWVVDTLVDYNKSISGPGASQTSRFNSRADSGAVYCGSSDESASGATTMTWTLSASTYWAEIGVALIPASAGTSCTPTLTLTGVGRCG